MGCHGEKGPREKTPQSQDGTVIAVNGVIGSLPGHVMSERRRKEAGW